MCSHLNVFVHSHQCVKYLYIILIITKLSIILHWHLNCTACVHMDVHISPCAHTHTYKHIYTADSKTFLLG